MAEVKYEIIEHVADIGENSKGWQKEINVMTWGNSKNPCIDIRRWNRSDESKIVAGKGITLTLDEFKILQKLNIKNIEKFF